MISSCIARCALGSFGPIIVTFIADAGRIADPDAADVGPYVIVGNVCALERIDPPPYPPPIVDTFALCPPPPNADDAAPFSAPPSAISAIEAATAHLNRTASRSRTP
jgi:hypothetical protein